MITNLNTQNALKNYAHDSFLNVDMLQVLDILNFTRQTLLFSVKCKNHVVCLRHSIRAV